MGDFYLKTLEQEIRIKKQSTPSSQWIQRLYELVLFKSPPLLDFTGYFLVFHSSLKIENISVLLLKFQNDTKCLQKAFGSIVVLSWKSSHLIKSQNIMIQIQKAFSSMVVLS